MFDWNEMKAFLAVARGGSTVAAARAMRVNQTTVGRWLENLERDLGTRLVDRAQGGTTLTEAGQALVAAAEAMERAAEDVERTVAGQRRSAAGIVRVTCSEALANMGLVPFLPEFRTLYPEISLELAVSDRMLDLEAGEADVAIRNAVALPDSSLIARKLATVDWHVYCSRDYALRRGKPEGLDDLKGHALILGEGEAERLPGMGILQARAGEAEVVLTFSSLTSMIPAIRAGLGVGPMPHALGDEDPDLVRICTLGPEARADTWLITRPELKDVPRVRAFMDFIAPRLADMFRQTNARIAAARERGEPS